MREPLVIGVMGGLGPEASLDFYRQVIERTPAKSDQEHLHLIIDSNPRIPNRNEALAGRGPSPGPALAACARRLEQAGADFLVMTSNTTHAFAPEFLADIAIPFVSLLEEAADAVRREAPQARRVGVMATSGGVAADIFARPLASRGLERLQLEGAELDAFMDLVYRIKAGERDRALGAAMRDLALGLVARGAEVLIAGCTEIPLVLAAGDVPVAFIDPNRVLAERAIAYARGEAALPGAAGAPSPCAAGAPSEEF